MGTVREKFETREPAGHLEDGTPYFGLLGVLEFDEDQERIRCHLCGRWFRALAPGHLQRAHGWDHRDYKAAFGLTLRRPLQIPRLRDHRRVVMRDLLDTSSAVREALVAAQAKMRGGELDHLARAPRRGPQPLEHQRKSAEAARRATIAVRARADARRLVCVRKLGYETVTAYLLKRYVEESASFQDVRRELRTGQVALGRLLDEAGIVRRLKVGRK